VYRKEGVKRGEGMKERKTSGVKTFLELARPLASAYVCLCGQSTGTSRIKCGHQTAISNNVS